ncbi:MAG TPA: PP0621 family protein [Albitalea sp.]|uniref:PP0621 family protein n=1 Tax=Piscinibacter sp. TaxID=1903157 RepID=UPI002ED1798A
MKYLLVLLIVLAVLWLARSSRRPLPPRPDPRQDPAPDRQQAIVACAHCGLHLPRDEALPGRGGVFCGEAHRTEYEKAHPTA